MPNLGAAPHDWGFAKKPNLQDVQLQLQHKVQQMCMLVRGVLPGRLAPYYWIKQPSQIVLLCCHTAFRDGYS